MSDLNPNAQKWVEALRSGKFEQGRNRLRTEDGYCCLGVACEVYKRETGNGDWNDSWFVLGGVRLNMALPEPVRIWLGLSNASGRFGNEYAEASRDYLTDRNDQGASFEEIAAVIERKPEGLFEEDSK